MNIEEAKIINNDALNRLMVAPIDSEDAKCHPDLGDGRTSYKNQEYPCYIFSHGEQWYVAPYKDSVNCGWVGAFPMDQLGLWFSVFGTEFILYKDLPEVTNED